MKKIICTLAFFCLLSMGYASHEIAEEGYLSGNKFSVGQDVFCSIGFAKTELEKSKSYGMFYGVKASYEHEVQDQIYFGLSTHYAPGLQVYTCEPRKEIEDENFPAIGFMLKKHKIHSTVQDINSEARIGYCYRNASDLNVVPFVALGMYYKKTHNNHTLPDRSTVIYKYDLNGKFVYYSLGIKISYEMISGLKIGVQAKVNRVIYGKYIFKDSKMKIVKGVKNKFGYDLSLPMSCSFDGNKWGLTFEPYFSKIDYKENSSNLGTRISASINY